MPLSKADRRFLNDISRTLIPPSALRAVDIDVAVNVDRMIERATPRHQVNVCRLIRWSRRLSMFYGGASMPRRAAGSRLVPVQKIARAITSLCLVAFWGDDHAHALIQIPGGSR
jgi:hypothetical protein